MSVWLPVCALGGSHRIQGYRGTYKNIIWYSEVAAEFSFFFFFGFQISRDEYVLLSNNDPEVFSAEIILKNYTSDFVFSRVTRRRINS